MRFSFEVDDKGKIRRGTVEEADYELARASLESKGFVVNKLMALEGGRSAASPWRLLCGALCLLGGVGAFWSVFLGAHREEATPPGMQTLALEVRGELQGDLSKVSSISVLFPQLPCTIEAPWSEAGDNEGRYSLRREILTSRAAPLYFQVRALDQEGVVLSELDYVRFDPQNQRGQAQTLTVD